MADEPWYLPIIQPTVGHETAGTASPYTAMNLNRDGNGLSFGPIQWTQRSGNLGALLKRAQAASPSEFARVFGSGASSLLSAVTSTSDGTRMSLRLWGEPWVSRFRAFGSTPVFQRVIDDVIGTDQHMKAALYAADTLGVHTVRGLALFYDYAVRGPARVYTAADSVAEKLGLSGEEVGPDSGIEDTGVVQHNYDDILDAFAVEAANHHRRSSPGDSGVWKPSNDGTYHRYDRSGTIDIYASVKKRQEHILDDDSISDDLAVLPYA